MQRLGFLAGLPRMTVSKLKHKHITLPSDQVITACSARTGNGAHNDIACRYQIPTCTYVPSHGTVEAIEDQVAEAMVVPSSRHSGSTFNGRTFQHFHIKCANGSTLPVRP